MIASGNGRPSRVQHLQDIDYSDEPEYVDDYQPSGEDEDDNIYAGCEFLRVQLEGDITSPNWPKKYPDKKKCHWTIEARDRQYNLISRVSLIFLSKNMHNNRAGSL